MQKAKAGSRDKVVVNQTTGVPVIPREYAGK
jgi:hypothetical protein